MSTRREPRGGAAVELAVLMVMLVPLVMYTLYLEDLLFYKLDEEETVISTPWDFSHNDFRHRDKAKILSAVTILTRQTYWDHTSAWNTYSNPKSDGADAKHHQALAAHQCWLAKGGKQVTCGWDDNLGNGNEVDPGFQSTGGSHGSLVRCSATLGVQNYFLPERFLGHAVAYSHRFTAQSGAGVIHSNAKEDNWLFPEEFSAIVHDSWALNWIKRSPQQTTTGGSGAYLPRAGDDGMAPLLDPSNHPQNLQTEWSPWVARPYDTAGQNRMKTVTDFGQSLVNEFLSSQAIKDQSGDDVSSAPLAYDKDPTHQFGTFFPSGYRDDREQQTKSAMENSYMGMSPSRW